MKIRSLKLNNYKKFTQSGAPYEYNFFDRETGEINYVTLVTGNNGAGKTTLLHAIASVVGGAVIDKFKPSDLEWPGFVYKYLQNGRYPVEISIDLAFEQDEVAAIREFCTELQHIYPAANKYKMPPDQNHVTIYLDYENDKVRATRESGMDAFFLTKGHQYAKMLESKDKNYGERFERVGSILWYDEHRTAASITKYLLKDALSSFSKTNQSNAIRELVARWYYASVDLGKGRLQLRPGQFNKFAKLKGFYEMIFRGRELRGATLSQGGGNGVDIVFFDGRNEYDFSEMSAGERAIFPILLDFANQNINNSIILIDEMELHLHPPLQQQFLDALPHLGRNNQFIITTHSPFIASQFPDEKKIVIRHE